MVLRRLLGLAGRRREGMAAAHGLLLEVHGERGAALPATIADLWRDLRGPHRDPSLSPEQAKALIDAMLFPPPTAEEVERALRDPGPGGLPWDERLKRWEHMTRQAMLNELTVGLASAENVDQLRRRLKPLADGLAWKAQRIARTEGRRVAERDYQDRLAGLGDLLDGQQIVAVMDEWTRPAHAARHGRIFRRGADGVFRDERGGVLPDLPDAPNCRCMTIPVLAMPEEFRGDPAARAAFETAAGRLIPDPASYADWWERAGRKERSTAVGAKRYQAVRDLVGREPEWTDFLGPDGELLSVAALRSETPARRQERKTEVEAILDARRRMFQSVASRGYALGSGTARPEVVAAVPMLRGGYPHPQILDALEMGDPKGVAVIASDRRLVDAFGQELFRRPIEDADLARLAGGLDGADVLASIEGDGLRLEMRRGGVRAVRWIGPDQAGVLKLELIRMDVEDRQQRRGLATRSLARSVQMASRLGARYADATANRGRGQVGYYALARYGFDARLPHAWLAAHGDELAAIGIHPTRISDLMGTEDGRVFWRLHGRTMDVTMDLREGSRELWTFGEYIQQRRREGRMMAESKRRGSGADGDLEYPIYDSQHGLYIDEEDEAIWDRIWSMYPPTEEDRRRFDELMAMARPGTRGRLPEEARKRLEAIRKEGKDGRATEG
mgnify:CR=1 FL=1